MEALRLISDSSVLANAAMGLGLEEWTLAVWFAYVAVTIVFEAWGIGRWLKLSWPASLSISLLANALTTSCGTIGCLAPFLHTMSINPNPLLRALTTLSFYAMPSALIEAGIWQICLKSMRKFVPPELLGRTLLIHAIGIPVGLAVLLLPARPYQGTEGLAQNQRISQLRRLCQTKPVTQDGSRFINRIGPDFLLAHRDDISQPEDAWTLFYLVQFERFDTGEMKRNPFEWNQSLAGKPLTHGDMPDWTWFAREHSGRVVIWADQSTGELEVSYDGSKPH